MKSMEMRSKAEKLIMQHLMNAIADYEISKETAESVKDFMEEVRINNLQNAQLLYTRLSQVLSDCGVEL